MQNFYIRIKNAIDESITNIEFFKKKQVSSMVTKNDILVQKKIKQIIKKNFPDVKQFICEENFKKKTFNKVNFKKPFAIIDPIDGTENFFAEDYMFGSLISVSSKKKGDVDLIYIPKLRKIITRDNIKKLCRKPKTNNNISILSTKCLGKKKYKGSNFRIYGSSAFSFFQLITGKANQYVYCDGAKIWDCFTGLRLLKLTECNLENRVNNWILKPSFKIRFSAKWF